MPSSLHASRGSFSIVTFTWNHQVPSAAPLAERHGQMGGLEPLMLMEPLRTAQSLAGANLKLGPGEVSLVTRKLYYGTWSCMARA